MIYSMTGYGRGEASQRGITVTIELKSVNNRFFEISMRLPNSLILREQDVKEELRKKIVRGKLQLSCTLKNEPGSSLPIKSNSKAITSVMKLLNETKTKAKLKENISLNHLLKFSEIFEPILDEDETGIEWEVFKRALEKATAQLQKTRTREGSELKKDLLKRWQLLSENISKIENESKNNVEAEKNKFQIKIKELLKNENNFNSQRIETEIAILADKLDITEECVRFKAHLKFFIDEIKNKNENDSIGRKLTFLVQEITREANTIGSKSNNAKVSQYVVQIKEELEKIREQLQNIE